MRSRNNDDQAGCVIWSLGELIKVGPAEEWVSCYANRGPCWEIVAMSRKSEQEKDCTRGEKLDPMMKRTVAGCRMCEDVARAVLYAQSACVAIGDA